MDPRIFGVVPEHVGAVRSWLDAQDVPCVLSRDLYSPTVTGWAVLDGGCTEIHRYGLTSLPSGIRVVGGTALRLLIAELDLSGGPRPDPGAPFAGAPELRERHRGDGARDNSARERAELLASCETGEDIRAVAEQLLGPLPRGPGPGPTPGRVRPHGPMGSWRSQQWVEQQMATRRPD
ncbi:hypothetical protein [Pseudonocardia alni]|uniref:Uncharacterized protein n=1 Tax=Pseudonocardia alni TaxID=33907 RepID=A0AA44ZNG2_PSEA5|nr:hypothetical protein [Pseudonocardia alni]PKB29843.1 hypothetical protein ATL51_1489 [Pseudonocardia alni]